MTEKVLLPGASALERVSAHVPRSACGAPSRATSPPAQRDRLDALLISDDGRPSALGLRDGPYLRSGAELSRAVERLDQVRLLTAGLPRTSHVPPGRVAALARFATVAKAQAVARMPEERRMATLLAFVRILEATAQDDVLDLLDIIVTKLFSDAAAVGKKTRLRTIRDLDAAALKLRHAGAVLIDDTVDDAAVRAAAFAKVTRANLAHALEQIDLLIRPPGDLYFAELRAGLSLAAEHFRRARWRGSIAKGEPGTFQGRQYRYLTRTTASAIWRSALPVINRAGVEDDDAQTPQGSLRPWDTCPRSFKPVSHAGRDPRGAGMAVADIGHDLAQSELTALERGRHALGSGLDVKPVFYSFDGTPNRTGFSRIM
jgi:hypothetical protein